MHGCVSTTRRLFIRLFHSFGLLSRNSIGVSPRVPKSPTSSSRFVLNSLVSSSVIGLEFGVGVGWTYQDADSLRTTSRLTRTCFVQDYNTYHLLFMWVVDQYAVLWLQVQLPSLHIGYVHIGNTPKIPLGVVSLASFQNTTRVLTHFLSSDFWCTLRFSLVYSFIVFESREREREWW